MTSSFEFSRKMRGRFCSMAFMAPSEIGKPANPNVTAVRVRMCPRQKSRAACSGTPRATALSIASRMAAMQVAIVDSTTAGSKIAICSTVIRISLPKDRRFLRFGDHNINQCAADRENSVPGPPILPYPTLLARHHMTPYGAEFFWSGCANFEKLVRSEIFLVKILGAGAAL